MSPNDEGSESQRIIAALASGRHNIRDFVERVEAAMEAHKGNYQIVVEAYRGLLMLLGDERVSSQLLLQLIAEAKQYTGLPDFREYTGRIGGRGVERLFGEVGRIRNEALRDAPRLLTGKSFDERLHQYKKLTGHVAELWRDACKMYKRRHIPLCTFLSILTIEEIGKLGSIWQELIEYDLPKQAAVNRGRSVHQKHWAKQFMAVVEGAAINARIDRILGDEPIKQLLEDAKSHKIEKLRQSCLYIDRDGDRVVVPNDLVHEKDARFYVILAGELWVELLGHAPWDHEAMLDEVIAFEKEIGIPDDLIKEH